MQILSTGRGSYRCWTSELGRPTHLLGIRSLEQACPVLLCQAVRVPAGFRGHTEIRNNSRRIHQKCRQGKYSEVKNSTVWSRCPRKTALREISMQEVCWGVHLRATPVGRQRRGIGPREVLNCEEAASKASSDPEPGRNLPRGPAWCKEVWHLHWPHVGCRLPLGAECGLWLSLLDANSWRGFIWEAQVTKSLPFSEAGRMVSSS